MNQNDLSTLADSSTFLSALTDDDRALLKSSGRLTTHKKDNLILEEGQTVRGLSILFAGRARVVRAYAGTQVTIRFIAPGEVFGEMGLIEGLPASASIYCDSEECTAVFIDSSKLDGLLQSVPGFSVRFYRALSTILSQKVRELTARIPSLMVEEVAQVQRHATPHVGRADLQQLPPSFVEGIDGFKNAMAMAERMLSKEKKPVSEVQPIVSAACQAMGDGLQDHVKRNKTLSDAIGAYAFRETFPFIMASHFLDRTYVKPRGYAGDFESINVIYENRASGDGRLGPLIDEWALQASSSIAVRQRRSTLCQHISRILAAHPDMTQVPITSLAVGPGREFFDALENDSERRLRITGIDIDPESLNFVAAHATELGVADRIRLVQGNIIRMARGKSPVEISPQQLVYSIGLMDYLEDAIVIACLDWIFSFLAPGGEVIIGNFDTNNPNKAFMDYVCEWVLIHRSPDDLREIFARSKFGERPVEVTSDTTNVQLFARCVK